MTRGILALLLPGLVLMSTTPASAQPLGSGKSAAPSQNAEALRLYTDVRHTLGFSASELIGIDRAIKLNPGIVSAAFARLGGRTDVRRRLTNGDPRVLADLKNDLLQRAQLVAMADGRVLSAATPKALSLEALSPSPSTLGIPKKDLSVALAALAAHVQVVKPLCPDGQPRPGPDGTDACITGDPYSAGLFSSVVPLFVNGQIACTGTLIDRETLLTAAHCLVDLQAGSLLDAREISVLLPGVRAVSSVSNPRVPPAMLRPCKAPDFACPDFSLDVGLLSYAPASGVPASSFPSVTQFGSAGRIAITMAGYGATTLIPDPSSNGLYIGRQSVEMSSPDAALSWIYNFSTDDASSTCLGDSGGPIFLGNPRRNGDVLRIVAVTSRIQRALGGSTSVDPATALCRNADVRAVNLATKEVAQAVCSLAGGRLGFCKP